MIFIGLVDSAFNPYDQIITFGGTAVAIAESLPATNFCAVEFQRRICITPAPNDESWIEYWMLLADRNFKTERSMCTLIRTFDQVGTLGLFVAIGRVA